MKIVEKSTYLPKLKEMVNMMEAARRNPVNPTEIHLSELLAADGITYAEFLADMGVEPNIDTISNLMTTTDVNQDLKWLFPEILRDAIRLGLRKAPIFQDFIAAEQSVNAMNITVPFIQMSDATPEYVGEGETIPLGGVSFGQKSLKLRKLGKGIKITDEVRRYVALNVVAIYLQDFGIKLGQGLDKLLIDVLINGEQADGSESAPVVGVAVVLSGITYADLLKVWIRMSRMGRQATKMIGGEDMANTVLNLSEFKDRNSGTPNAKLNLKTPIPNAADFYVHGAVPADQLIAVDSSATVIKYNAPPLLVETDRIVSNQTNDTYATLSTGFAIIYRDARIVIDQSLAFGSGHGFPSYMDVDAAEDVEFRD